MCHGGTDVTGHQDPSQCSPHFPAEVAVAPKGPARSTAPWTPVLRGCGSTLQKALREVMGTEAEKMEQLKACVLTATA